MRGPALAWLNVTGTFRIAPRRQGINGFAKPENIHCFPWCNPFAPLELARPLERKSCMDRRGRDVRSGCGSGRIRRETRRIHGFFVIPG
jgi:hypothetical protein